MIKKTAFAFFLSLTWSMGFAQYLDASQIDSLKHLLSKVKDDISRMQVMTELSNAYLSFRLDSSFYYAQQALMLARKNKFPKGEFEALFRMGNTLSIVGNYPRALVILLKALRIAEKHNFLNGKADIYRVLGVIYRDAGDYSKAVDFHHKSRQLNDSLQNQEQSAGLRNMLAMDYSLMKNTDSAQYYAQLAYEATNRWKVEWLRTGNFFVMGSLQTELGNFPLALDYLHKSAHYGHVRQQYVNTPKAYLLIAKIYQQTNQPDSTFFYAQKALADAQKGNIYNEIREASLFLSSLYKQKNTLLALQYQQSALAANDSLYNFGNLTAIQNQVAFDEDERLYEIETAQTALRNKVWRYTLLAGLGLFLLIAFMLYRNNQKEKKAKILLQEKNQIIEQSLVNLKATQAQLIQSEKMASLGELTAGIAHEIQNPLNFVNNFSELNNELIKEIKLELAIGNEQLAKGEIEKTINNLKNALDVSNDIEANSEKINQHGHRASSIVKGMLEHSRQSSGEKTLTDINALCDEYLKLSYHGLRAKDKNFNVDFKTDLDPNMPKINVVSQDIARVLLNIINNAFQACHEKSGSLKTESQEGYRPCVIITTNYVASLRRCEIIITDNGPGIPDSIKDKIFQPFFTTKPTGQGTGLGLSLAYDIVTKTHGGTLEVQSTEGMGSEFTISLPLKTNG